MSGFRPLLVVSCIILSSACVTAPRPALAFPLTEKLSKSIVDGSSVSVQVNVFRHGHGSGVIISKDGYVLTCEHLTRHVGRADVVATVTDGRNKPLRATIVAADPRRDLVLLKVDATFERAADLEEPAAGSTGQHVFGFRSRKGEEREISLGVIKKYPFSVDMRPAELTDYPMGLLVEMPSGGGTSGRGVFSAETGRLLGIHKMSFRDDDQDLSVLISSAEIRGFLAENHINLK